MGPGRRGKACEEEEEVEDEEESVSTCAREGAQGGSENA